MATAPASIADRFPRQATQLQLLLGLALFCLLFGLIAPIVTLEKFYLFENTFSVLSGVVQLWYEGQYFLFLLISGFSVVLPLAKLGVLLMLVVMKGRQPGQMERYLEWMHHYGKWSMLDVFVVALLVVSVKLGAIAQVEMRYGLYAFAAAVALTMVITAWVVRLTDRLREEPRSE